MTGQVPEGCGVAEAVVALGCGRAAAAAWLEAMGGLRGLAGAEAADFARAPGVGRAWAARLHAAVKLGMLASRQPPPDEGPVTTPEAAYARLAPALRGLAHEELHALYLDRRGRVLAHRRLTNGSARFTVVDPPQVFRPAVALDAAAVILAHNHPSGDATPSGQDREVTRRVAEAGKALGIALHDHLVLGHDTFTSLAQGGMLGGWRPVAAAWTA